MPVIEDSDPIESVDVNNVIQSTAYHCMSSGKDVIYIGDIIASLYNLKESFASYILQKNGVKN